MSRSLFTTALAATLALAGATAAFAREGATAEATQAKAAPLRVQAYNPGDKGIFQVSSVLVTGARDAVLIDAQFSTVDAAKLVDLVRASGKHLTTIYISQGDPDFYFGLETLKAAFPDVRIVATPQTVAHIEATYRRKLDYWSKPLGAGAPKRVIVPEALQGDRIALEGQDLRIVGLDGPAPDRTFVWIPSIRTVAGGVLVFGGEYVWMADTQTPQSHADWIAALDGIIALKPQTVIPGHYTPGTPQTLEPVRFTAGYIRAYDEETAKAKTSGELVAAMQKRYPGLAGASSLELSAKVSKGEMQWP